ncbi:Mobile element protein [Photobacterium marinum]|uniref:Mobile element protein n=1 Tax=Photobacterium marinum TaxID=1056511 RepID=L8J824_9GAMM|nr:Mobile element protein [Photobacterium marinum]
MQSCPNPASVEGAYRLIRNPDVEANAIAEAGFAATTNEAEAHDLLLALEDSTALTYTHKSLSNELGHVNSGDASSLCSAVRTTRAKGCGTNRTTAVDEGYCDSRPGE